jgi:hypothetical protein
MSSNATSIEDADQTFEERVANAGNFAKAWIWDEDGATVMGEVVAIGERINPLTGDPYPIITLKLQGGEERAVHGLQAALRGQIGQASPRLGERVGIKRGAEKRKPRDPARSPYWPFSVIIEGREDGSAIDLGKYAQDSDDGPTPAASDGDERDDVPF